MATMRIFGLGILLFIVLTAAGCKGLVENDRPADRFKETDYLNQFAGLYRAQTRTAGKMDRVVTLQLYSDGTCLLTEKDLGRSPDSVGVRYGRWDHSDFPDRINLHLSTPQGAKSLLAFEKTEAGLVHNGNGFGQEGLTLAGP